MISLAPLAICWITGAIYLGLDGRKRWVGASAAVWLTASFLLDLFLLLFGAEQAFEVTTGHWPRGVGIRLRVDALSLLFGAASALVLSAVMIHEAVRGVRSRLFPSLLLLLSAGLHGAFFTGDLFNFYVFFELSVVTSFALAAYGYGRAEIRGTFIYVAVNLLGSFVFLVGVAVVYLATGTLDFAQLAERIGDGPETLILPAALLFAALSVKLGLFPFHSWVPVLYSHARPTVAAAMSGALVNLGIYGMLRIGFSVLSDARNQSSIVLSILGSIALVYGAVLAVRRKRRAEIIAYSSIVHAGYLVLGFGIGGPHGIAAVLLMMLAGSVDKSTMFLSIDGRGAFRSFSSLVAAISVAGLPLTAGFIGKVQLFRAALEAPGAWAIVLALSASTTLMLVASFRFWRISIQAGPPKRSSSLMALGLVFVTLAIGLHPEPVINLSHALATALLGGAP